MVEKYQYYLNQEYILAQSLLMANSSWIKPREVVENAMQRGLGAYYFIADNNLSQETQEMEHIYNLFKEKLWLLLTN